jgi:hypothetical protein
LRVQIGDQTTSGEKKNGSNQTNQYAWRKTKHAHERPALGGIHNWLTAREKEGVEGARPLSSQLTIHRTKSLLDQQQT